VNHVDLRGTAWWLSGLSWDLRHFLLFYLPAFFDFVERCERVFVAFDRLNFLRTNTIKGQESGQIRRAATFRFGGIGHSLGQMSLREGLKACSSLKDLGICDHALSCGFDTGLIV